MQRTAPQSSPENTAVSGPPVTDGLDQRLRAGDQEALAEAFEACWSRLRQVVEFRLDSKLRARLDAEDVLQEAFLAARRRLDHYAGGPYSSPFIWLRAIVAQTMVDLYRRHVGARKRTPEQEVRIDANAFPNSTSSTLAIQLVGGMTSPGEAAARADMMGVVEAAMAGMDPVDQEVLALRHFEELSNREVAEALGIQQKAASTRYVRAIRRLRDVLGQLTAYFRSPR